MKEIEKKYLISTAPEKLVYDREQLVFQWYEKADESGSTKLKIIFDFTRLITICVRITKHCCGVGINEKSVDYLDIASLDLSQCIGMPFVEKRRGIAGKVFIDRFVRSNMITEYLMEIEDNAEMPLLSSPSVEVTGNKAYDNANMCTSFEKEDLAFLQRLLNIWII